VRSSLPPVWGSVFSPAALACLRGAAAGFAVVLLCSVVVLELMESLIELLLLPLPRRCAVVLLLSAGDDIPLPTFVFWTFMQTPP